VILHTSSWGEVTHEKLPLLPYLHLLFLSCIVDLSNLTLNPGFLKPLEKNSETEGFILVNTTNKVNSDSDLAAFSSLQCFTGKFAILQRPKPQLQFAHSRTLTAWVDPFSFF